MAILLRFLFLLFVLIFIVSSCASIPSRNTKASIIAEKNGFNIEKIKSGKFLLTTYKKEKTHKNNMVVYIEGDGFSWKRKHIQSKDPTPKDSVTLKLATKDPGSTVLYIARPCQYLSQHELNGCHPRYWSTHRYAEEVIQAINNVIGKEKLKSNVKSISLVGYSGGGTIAALIAARRQDITNLITIAANLDHEKWTEIHSITPLSGSLNAADYVKKIEHIPQLHFIGGKDKIVPASIVESYRSKTNNLEKIKVQVVSDFNHQCCWVEQWPMLLQKAASILTPMF